MFHGQCLMFPYFQICWWVVIVCPAVVSLSESQEKGDCVNNSDDTRPGRQITVSRSERRAWGWHVGWEHSTLSTFLLLAAYSDQASVLDTLIKTTSPYKGPKWCLPWCVLVMTWKESLTRYKAVQQPNNCLMMILGAAVWYWQNMQPTYTMLRFSYISYILVITEPPWVNQSIA